MRVHSVRQPKFHLLPLAAAVMFVSQGSLAESDTGSTTQAEGKKALEAFVVYGEQGDTDTATNLELPLFETPQTVTAISRVQIDDFSLNKVNQVLDYTPGVTVEEVETDRTYYTARGFDIVSFQYDGIGVPFFAGINGGQQDTAIYEKVEIVKGAAGLITGVANPSATINYVRKRPTEALQAGTRLSVNEWNGYRLDGDVSGSLTDNIRARLVVATEDTESYLDRHKDHTNLFYGVIEADLSDSTLFTIGHSYDESNSDGVLWGALPLLYVDGTQTDYDVSTSSAPDWTYTDNVEKQTFVELKQQLNEQWTLNAIYTHTTSENESELLYLSGTLNLDETGQSLFASDTEDETDSNVFDISVSGDFYLFDRAHQLVFGYNHVDLDNKLAGYFDGDEATSVGADWAEGNTPRPSSFETLWGTGDIDVTQKSLYLASRLNFTDRLSIILGARDVELEQRGISYGAVQDMDADETVPYYGATFLLTESLMAYGSYSEVFTPQNFVNEQLAPLGPTEGTNSEIGLKKSFNDERAILTFALFQAEHNNLGEHIGISSGVNVYASRDYESEGYEVEISGELTDGLNVGAGFTELRVEDDNDDEVRPFVPEKLLKVSASYRIPGLPKLKVGGVLKWQDDITTANGLAEQDAYSLLDLTARYDITDNVSVDLLVENVSDEKYYNSLYWGQAYYGAPLNAKASVSWTY